MAKSPITSTSLKLVSSDAYIDYELCLIFQKPAVRQRGGLRFQMVGLRPRKWPRGENDTFVVLSSNSKRVSKRVKRDKPERKTLI